MKFRWSLHAKRVFDMPRQTVQRYIEERVESSLVFWRFNHKCQSMIAGQTLRVEVLVPAVVHWNADDWQHPLDMETRDTGLGVHIADLGTAHLGRGRNVRFTFQWRENGRWEGRDFVVGVR